MYLVSEAIRFVVPAANNGLSADSKTDLGAFKKQIDNATKFIPLWVKVAVAIALGLGTMIGWKRIVVTVGEKIGKGHLSYAQGASAEIVAALTIGAADKLGLPVSTTHVLSSGVAGTMFANRSGLQTRTVRNLLLAWVLTLPVCVLLGAAVRFRPQPRAETRDPLTGGRHAHPCCLQDLLTRRPYGRPRRASDLSATRKNWPLRCPVCRDQVLVEPPPNAEPRYTSTAVCARGHSFIFQYTGQHVDVVHVRGRHRS